MVLFEEREENDVEAHLPEQRRSEDRRVLAVTPVFDQHLQRVAGVLARFADIGDRLDKRGDQVELLPGIQSGIGGESLEFVDQRPELPIIARIADVFSILRVVEDSRKSPEEAVVLRGEPMRQAPRAAGIVPRVPPLDRCALPEGNERNREKEEKKSYEDRLPAHATTR